jgi:hypothetical protein
MGWPGVEPDPQRFEFGDMILHLGSPQSWGFDVPLATALSKTFLLRMLNEG